MEAPRRDVRNFEFDEILEFFCMKWPCLAGGPKTSILYEKVARARSRSGQRHSEQETKEIRGQLTLR